MLLTSIAIAGGLFMSGRKIYQGRERTKLCAKLSLVEHLSQHQLPASHDKSTHGTSRVSINALDNVLGDRQGQLAELSSTGEVAQTSDAEKEMNRYLTLSVACFGLTTLGTLFYPPLMLLSVPGLVYLTSFFFKRSYELIRQEGRVAVALVDCLSFVGTLVTGHYFACSLAYTIFYFSKKLLIKTEDHSRKSLQDVFGQKPNTVWIQKDDLEIEVAFDTIQAGDVVVVQAGQMIPVDGILIKGTAAVDQRALTGESQPVEKDVGDSVLASTLLLSGKIYIQVEKAGQETVASQIGDMLNATADFKSSIVSRGEKIIERGAMPTLALSALALPFFGINSAVAMLYTAFGYNMRSAAPISVLNFLNMASQNGILIKDGRSLELLADVDTFVFDKTGTLTQDQPHVSTIYTASDLSENDLLTYAAAAEHRQAHPIALAILEEADQRALDVPTIGQATIELGYGLKVYTLSEQNVEDKLIHVGSSRFMALEGIALPDGYHEAEGQAHENGHSLVYVAIDHTLGGAIELVPTIRPEAQQIIDDLHERNIKVMIISGDHEKPTQKLAQALNIDQYFAEVLPQNKAALVEQLQNEGRSVCFVGDGINDAIALKQATVSVSLRGASSAATDTASIVLMDTSLKQITPLLELASELDKNLTSSTALTVVPGIICAGGVFFLHLGIVSALLLFNFSLVASLSNAMRPLIKHQRRISQSNRSVL